jgi:hypothetical protein
VKMAEILIVNLLIPDPGLPEPLDPASLASQVDESWHASMLARKVSWGVTECSPHLLQFTPQQEISS